jgi:hypothetical protein
MYSATPIIRTLGVDFLVPGIICVVLASLLLSWWQLRHLTITRSSVLDRWLPPVAIAVGFISFALIAVRFIVIA